MSKARAFEYIQLPIAVVADDLAHLSIEAEGAYLRVVRKLAVKGPMRIEDIRAQVMCDTTSVEHLLDYRSTDDQQLLSIGWVEEWRERATAARARLSKAGTVSAEKRAKKKKGRNTSSTHVEHTLKSSSTNVEHATILYSTLSEKEEKERAHKIEAFMAPFEALLAKTPTRLLEGERSKFIAYWTEANSKGKMRFEGEDYFDYGRRMDTWMGNYRSRPNGKTKDLHPTSPKPGTIFDERT